MKKSLLLTVLLALWSVSGFAFINGVNLVTNGGFEDDNFNAYTKTESCVINTTDAHSGTNSCEQTGGTKDIAQAVPVTGGLSYKVSFWYKVKTEDDGTDARIWSYIAGGDMAADVTAKLKGPDNGYLLNVTEWTKYEVIVETQAEATHLNFELRVYGDAVVLWDDLSVVEQDIEPADAMPKVMDVMPESGVTYKEGEQFEVSAIVTTTDPAGIDTVMLATGSASDALNDTVAMPGADGNYSTPVVIDEAGTYFGQVIAVGKNGKVTVSSVIEVNVDAVTTYPVIELERADYQVIVDSVNARELNTETSFTTTTENYYGVSSYHDNFKVTNYNTSAFVSAEAAIKEALATIILPVKMDTAEVGDTVKVKFAMYGGDSNSGEMVFVCLQKSPLVFMFPGETLPADDTTKPEWADSYPFIGDVTGETFSMYFKASELCTGYGVLMDTMPTTKPTKEEIKAYAAAGENAGAIPIGTEEVKNELDRMKPETTYYLYVFLEDAAGNQTDTVAVLTVTTLEADTYSELVMEKPHYQVIVDSVNARGNNTHKFPNNSDNYYGASAYYGNFSVGAGSFNAMFATSDFAIDEALRTILLPAAEGDARVNDTIAVKYAMYGGDSSEGEMKFKCTSIDPITFENLMPPVAPAEAGFYSFTMDSVDYQIIIDTVNARELNTSSYPETGDDYYGASSYHKNFSVGDGKYSSNFANADTAIAEALATILLPAKYSSAVVNDTIEVKYKMYGGSAIFGKKAFVCTATDPSVFELIELEEQIETSREIEMTSNDFQIIVDTVNARGDNSHSYPDNSDNYYGASAYHTNFAIGSGAFSSTFSSSEHAIEEALRTVLLPAIRPLAAVNDTFDVSYKTWDGSSAGAGEMQFVCTSTDPLTFAYTGTLPAALNEAKSLGLAVYPNPATSVIYLTKAVDAVEVINLAGKTMTMATSVGANASVDISTLNAGIYMVKVTVDGQSAMTKLIKK